MALIRSLPADYAAFTSTVVLMQDFSYEKVKEAFILEEHNRQARQQDADQQVALANAAKLAKFRHNQSSFSPSTANNLKCTFCEGTTHTQETCYKYRDFKLKAVQERLEDLANKKGQYKSRGGQRNYQNKANASSEIANSSQQVSPTPEYAGNASALVSLDTPSQSDYKWNADTGATSCQQG